MSDLSRFGVPIDGNKLGILQPKLQYRFRVIFNNFGTGDLLKEMTQNIVTVERPKIEYESVAIHAYNSVAYAMGKHEWQPISITLRDDITNSVISAVGSQVQRQLNHFEQTGPVAGINFKFQTEIHALDGTNQDEMESWILDGCFLTNVDYSDNDYSSSEPVTVSLTIRYDNATHIAGPNTNDGTTVGGDPFPAAIGGLTGGTTIG